LSKVLMKEGAQQLIDVEASIRPTFEAFPKNSVGYIPSREIFPAIVRNYFAKEHGWTLKGLEPMSLRSSVVAKVEEVEVLKMRAPDVAAALRAASEPDLGLSLSDIVGTVAALEHLLIEESMAFLAAAYELNGRNAADALAANDATEILRSFLLLYRWGATAEMSDQDEHKKLKDSAREAPDWTSLVEFVSESSAAQFGKSTDATNIDEQSMRAAAREIVVKFGKWQNRECQDMKDTLLRLAPKPETGLVPFATFAAEPDHEVFQFSEDEPYLKKIGVLWEADPPSKLTQVRIANYLLGPTNCIAPNDFYMVCCLSECEDIINDLESRVQAPAAEAEQLLKLVQEIGTTSLEAPHVLTEAVSSTLKELERSYENTVPIHSPEFRQWLNLAFPNECPHLSGRELEEESQELRVAREWQENSKVCTRLPQWHPHLAEPPRPAGEVEIEVDA